MSIRLIAISVATLTILAACATDEQRHRATCAERGLEKGTPAFSDCVNREYQLALRWASRKHSKK
jgi:hypothetical protein